LMQLNNFISYLCFHSLPKNVYQKEKKNQPDDGVG